MRKPKLLACERRLTPSQHDALDAFADEDGYDNVAVVAWDTAVSGPLITLDRLSTTGPYVAISPRGKTIPREKGSVLL